MGQLTLPSFGVIYIDTPLLIYNAIHAATALSVNCNQFLTNDKGFRNVPSLPIIILSEVLES
ncbi:type II toxin-antitoxin system VapC family toxin [Nostoc sp. MG11]|uniref:type II toxin-antitoxin system VapC family toxin n=1 Tax=Nostoc sp. MG11 TaxID=2721166 RepID=UPI001868087A|nr:hypothetical protein [Nostoc sp. MG11]